MSETEEQQPHNPTPLVTSAGRLTQDFKSDFVRQNVKGGATNWIFDNSRGLNLVPTHHLQFSFNLPPFIEHSAPKSRDGFGDVSFNLRYRMLSRTEGKGNYVVTPYLSASVPTGKNGNGSCCAVVTPSLIVGKGVKNVAFLAQMSGSLPVTNAIALGHNLTGNAAVEWNPKPGPVGRFFWVELESNTTHYVGGSNDGNTQSFLTPGALLGRFPLTPKSRTNDPGHRQLALSLGFGEQIAVTRFKTYNHGLVCFFRLPF